MQESGVGEGLIERGIVLAFAGFQNLTAIETLDVLGLVILGDQAHTLVLADRGRHWAAARPTVAQL